MSDKPFSLSAKVVVHDGEGRCLLLKRSISSRENPGKWDLPGGKIEIGEKLEEGLLREVAEETGLTISLLHVLGAAESETAMNRVANLIMEGQVESGQVRLSSEHDDFTWVDRESLARADIAEQFAHLLKAYNKPDNKPVL